MLPLSKSSSVTRLHSAYENSYAVAVIKKKRQYYLCRDEEVVLSDNPNSRADGGETHSRENVRVVSLPGVERFSVDSHRIERTAAGVDGSTL